MVVGLRECVRWDLIWLLLLTRIGHELHSGLHDLNAGDLETLLAFVETGEDMRVLRLPHEQRESGQVPTEVVFELVLGPLPARPDAQRRVEAFGGVKGPVINHLRVVLVLLHPRSVYEQLDFRKLNRHGEMMPLIVTHLVTRTTNKEILELIIVNVFSIQIPQ